MSRTMYPPDPQETRHRRAVVRLSEEELARRLALPAGTHVRTLRHDYATERFELLVYSDRLEPVEPGVEGPVVGPDLIAPAPVRERQVSRLGDVLKAVDEAVELLGEPIAYALAGVLGVTTDELDELLLVRP